MVKERMPGAYGFIYVINTTKAGGIQEGEVCFIMQIYKYILFCYKIINVRKKFKFEALIPLINPTFGDALVAVRFDF